MVPRNDMFDVQVARALAIATVFAESARADRPLLCCKAGNSWGCSRRPEATVLDQLSA